MRQTVSNVANTNYCLFMNKIIDSGCKEKAIVSKTPVAISAIPRIVGVPKRITMLCFARADQKGDPFIVQVRINLRQILMEVNPIEQAVLAHKGQ